MEGCMDKQVVSMNLEHQCQVVEAMTHELDITDTRSSTPRRADPVSSTNLLEIDSAKAEMSIHDKVQQELEQYAARVWQSDVLQRRTWTDRPQTSFELVVLEAGELLDVISLDSGAKYFGQTVPRDEANVPHGLGVRTDEDGSKACGYYSNGQLTSYGTLRSEVFSYEGMFQSNQPEGYGIGRWSCGYFFQGVWKAGKPFGLGRLHNAMKPLDEDCEIGWFDGIANLRPCTCAHEDTDVAATQLVHHPQRGLHLLCNQVDTWCVRQLRRAMNTWMRLCCHNVLSMARESRLRALDAWKQANDVERQAWNAHMQRREMQYKVDEHDFLKAVGKAREEYDQMNRTKEFYAIKLNDAVLRNRAAKAVISSQEAVEKAVENQIRECKVRIEDTHEAETRYKQRQQELETVYSHIDEAAGTLADLDHQLHTLLASQATETTVEPTPRPTLPFVCDSDGCQCGIPRDVYLRVASVLNGDQ